MSLSPARLSSIREQLAHWSAQPLVEQQALVRSETLSGAFTGLSGSLHQLIGAGRSLGLGWLHPLGSDSGLVLPAGLRPPAYLDLSPLPAFPPRFLELENDPEEGGFGSYAWHEATDPLLAGLFHYLPVMVQSGLVGQFRRKSPTQLAFFALLIERHAPEGSAFRRYLIDRIRVLLNRQARSDEEFFVAPLINLWAVVSAIHDSLRSIIRSSQQQQRFCRRHTDGYWLPKLVDLVKDLRDYGLLEQALDYEENLLKVPLSGHWKELVGAIPFHEEILEANERLAICLDQNLGHLSQKKVAVVGYGLNLNAIRFFLDFGAEVAAVEKRGAALDWAAVAGPDMEEAFPGLSAAMGLPELIHPNDSWPQLSEMELKQALGYPKNLVVLEANDLQGHVGSFDLVVAPALVDEAVHTLMQLPRPGGFILADCYLYPRVCLAHDPNLLLLGTKSIGEILFDHEFLCYRPCLPTDYFGTHRAYLVRMG